MSIIAFYFAYTTEIRQRRSRGEIHMALTLTYKHDPKQLCPDISTSICHTWYSAAQLRSMPVGENVSTNATGPIRESSQVGSL